MIAVDTKELDNYISCDDNTRSEIVLPVLNKDGSFRTQLDIDSPDVATFNLDDQRALQVMIDLIYPQKWLWPKINEI